MPTRCQRLLRAIWALLLVALPLHVIHGVQGAEVDTSPLPLKLERAFPNMRFDRPIVFTFLPGDAEHVLMVSQKGKLHRVPLRDDVGEEQLELFLDWSEHVTYNDKQNEEGLIGFALHPQFAQNGQFFLHYTSADLPPHTSVVARFRVQRDNPRVADPSSYEEVLRIPQPFWNHNGGGLAFGPDGFLYIALGDGGKGNDPLGNGQNLWSWLGSILRIDVDHADPGKKYAVPSDNPFVGRKDAQPEIWAYGFRNIWGLSFDPQGQLWAADVGQDLWEEINLVERGGNYGWNAREGKHKFWETGSEASAKFIEPIWEYHHDVGKSITGGLVYRGQRHPTLQGHYLYADYVSGKVWALKYDKGTRSVVANRPVADPKMPIMAFGETAAGEVYLTDAFGQVWRIAAGSP
jgi:quinoprotein glucose dehydrogenase